MRADAELDPIIACARCGEPYGARINLVNNKPTWFPTCKHKLRDENDVALLDPKTLEPIVKEVAK